MPNISEVGILGSFGFGWILLFIGLAIIILPSIRIIGPTEVGLVTKRFSWCKLSEGNPIAFRGEAGYQADLLMEEGT